MNLSKTLPCPKDLILLLLGSLIEALGLCNIHAFSSVTEGGVLGLTLLIQHWTGLSPAVSSLVLNAVCFCIGWKTLGHTFLVRSAIACAAYSLFYALMEPFAPLWPFLISNPMIAAISGACLIGLGAGLSVRAGGAISGDDAIGMALSHRLKLGIQWIYLFTDLTVLLLSLSYIPFSRIIWSLITVVLSGQIIGWVQKAKLH